MKLRYDPEADAIYVYLLSEAEYAFGEEIDAERRVDYDQDDKPMGVELLNVSHGVNLHDLPRATDIARLIDREVPSIRVYA